MAYGGGIDRFEPPECLKKVRDIRTGFLIGHGEVLAYEENKVILDPHTAVGVGAAKKLSFNDCIVLSTAHPCKFPDATINAINKHEELPEELQQVLNKDENFKVLNNDTEEVKNFVKSKV